MEGGPSFVLWKKLKRLQGVLYKLSKPLLSANQQVSQARDNLVVAQDSLIEDKMNSEKISKVKSCTEDLIKWHDIGDIILKQRAKLNWIKSGDGNLLTFMPHSKVNKLQRL